MTEPQIISLEELAGSLDAGTRLLGLDLGTKTIGLALSDISRTIASPLETIRRTKFTNDKNKIAEISDNFQISAFVLGLPLNLDGTEGPRAQATRAFAANLTRQIDLPLAFWDERLSTVAAERTLLEADASRKRRSEVIDKMAAAFILQGALDRLANIGAG